MKEKTYVFRHWRKVECLPNSASQEALKEELVRVCLNFGYIPAYFKYEKFTDFARLSCLCAYAGKKMARVFYEKNKEMLQVYPTTIKLLPNK